MPSSCCRRSPRPSPKRLGARPAKYKLLNVTGNEELDQILHAPAILTAHTYRGLAARRWRHPDDWASAMRLQVYNWKKGTDRYYKLRKFVDVLYSGIGDSADRQVAGGVE